MDRNHTRESGKTDGQLRKKEKKKKEKREKGKKRLFMHPPISGVNWEKKEKRKKNLSFIVLWYYS